ncbi:coenzyme F430 synthase [Methanococcus aeolicus]|uniref:coenzyme F430 synthase n=1 Tax=Methanococcus aeolicus TaxID=42879 RepID=UPI0036F20699
MLIIDVNHGAPELAKEYIELGYGVSIWDIYGKLDKEKNFLNNINFKEINKINILKSTEEPKFNNYDKIIAPIHCPIDVDFMSFHDATAEIIKEKYGRIHKKFIEITGVKGKTTTTELINHILREEYNTYLNNSNKGSIAPVSILNCINYLNEINKIDFYDIFIFEVSLGLTSCEYGAITNILENYPIAKGRKDAFMAKCSTLKNANKKFVNKNLLKSDIFENIDTVIDINKTELLSKYPLCYEYNNKIVEFNNNIFGSHFIENSLFGIEICKNFMDIDTIVDKIKSFKINGRMNVVKKENNCYLIENINPGLNVKSIDNTINDFINEFINDFDNKNGYILIGGDFGCTCEEINIEKLSKVIKKYLSNKNIKFILSGDIGKELKKYFDFEYIDNINNIDYDKYNGNLLKIYRKKIC